MSRYKETNIPVSVGFAETKTLAKLANTTAKKSEKSQGVLDLYNSPHTDLALRRTSVGDIWGVGSRSTYHLNKYGIYTGFDLKNADPEQVRSYLNVFGARTVLELNGMRCLPMEITAKSNKSIAHTRTFGRAIIGFREIKNAIFYFATRALEKMRWNNLTTKTVTVFLKTDRFNPVPYYYSNACSYNSAFYSDITSEIYGWVAKCLDNVFLPNMHYRRAGVILSELIPVEAASLRLYGQENFERWHRLIKSVDQLNLRYGRDRLKFAVLEDDGMWQSQSTFLGNDKHHTVERERLGLGSTFSRPIRFL